jgi:hypothetical protein
MQPHHVTALLPTKKAPGSRRLAGFVRIALSVTCRVLLLIISILICLPVILLPLSTAVPAWVWISLGLADLGMIVLWFRLSPLWKGVYVCLGGMAV